MVQDEPNGEIVAATDRPRAKGEKKPNFFARIAIFIRQVFAELRKVVVPTRQELIKYSLVSIGFVVVVMAIVWGLDLLFTMVTNWVFGNPGGV
ncbi:preprotein translocase subunit SecE [Microbacterium sp. KR10-403]|jgi:preprotein translocase subunit SecE|uniref:preprotein translocase subunit SecE n=1 Tax=Microbacterium sp. KR10-403 TaxID=3158581 RepID=UPI0032E393D8